MIQPIQGYVIKVSSHKKPEKTELSRPLVAFFTWVQLIFGFNFGFAEAKRFKMAARFVTILSGSIMILALTWSFTIEVIGKRSNIVHSVQYAAFFITFLFAKYTLYDFLIDLPNETKETRSEYKKVEIMLWLYAALMFGGKITTAVVYCTFTICTDTRWSLIDVAFHVPMIALDVIPITSFIVFYHVYTRLRDMTTRYEHQEISLKQLQNTFKEVADNFEKFRRNYDAIFVCWFLTESIKWMLIIWNHLTLVRFSGSWWLHGSSYIWAFFSTTQICVPAVFAEMISVQADVLKLNLHEKLSVERDEHKKSALQCLLRYVSARPLLRRAWRLVPVDLQLPVTMLSICTTYLIVIIQFTHLFD